MLGKAPLTSRRKTVLLALLFAAILTVGFLVGRATAAQPHMQAALDHLVAAKAELQAAEENKGGHRTAALKLVNQAIAEVNAGIAYAASH